MGYLQDIIEEAVAKSTDLPRLLRLCMLLAQRLDYDPLGEWARKELNGYPTGLQVPDYRQLQVVNEGNFAGYWSGVFPIPLSRLPADLQDAYAGQTFRESIAEALDLVARSGQSGSMLKVPWPLELALHATHEMVSGSQCVGAWKRISVSAVAGLLDQVKTRVLDFALQIEKDFPTAGEVGGTSVKPPEAVMTHVFNMTIGSVQNLAAGSSEITQVAGAQIATGDWHALKNTLVQHGIQAGEMEALEAAVKSDEVGGKKSALGPAVAGWLSKAGQGAASQVISKAVLNYLGVS